jgi:hypothetical protein
VSAVRPDDSRQSWSQRFRERNHILLIFRDAVIALLVLVGLSGAVWALVVGIGIVAYFGGGPGLPTLAVIPVYGVPALVVLYGMVSARLGAILAPMLVAAAASVGSSALRHEDQAAIERFSIAALAPASRAHKVLALDGPDVTCDTACHRIIATSDATLARKSRYSKDWVLFRRGERCGDEAQAISALEFLRDGHRDVCEERTTAKDIGDALVLRVRSVPLDPLDAALPARFNGIIYEISERIAGKEQLLGRRIVGRLGAPFPFVIGAFGRQTETIDLGPKIDDKEFLAIATGMSSEALYGASQLSFAEQLDEIERYFDASSVKVAERARGLWESIAVVRGGAQEEELRARIVRMLASDDPRRMRAALNCLHRLRPANRAFAQDRILELAWSPLLTTTYASLFESLRSQLRSPAEPFPAALRERAKARFVGDTALTLQQRQIFFMFVVRGNSDTRREAVDMIFSLQETPFEDSVRAIHDGGHDVWALNRPEQWTSEEVDRLIARAPGVPNQRLSRYLYAFRFSHFVSKEQKAALVEQVRERLGVAEAADVRDDELIKSLKRLIEIIPTNTSS